MGKITSRFVHKVLRQVDTALDKREILRTVGIDPDAQVDPRQMVDDHDYYAFYERMARLDPQGHSLSLRVGESMTPDDYGAFGLAWKSALTPRDSCARLARYSFVLTSVAAYEIMDTDQGMRMVLNRAGQRRLGLRLSNETTLAAIVSMCRQVSTGSVRPVEVHLKHSAPATTGDHEVYFGCPICFDSDADALLFAHAEMARPNRKGDAGIVRFIDQHLDAELAGMRDDTALNRRVKNAVSSSLSAGVPKISAVAGRLGMSGRTLQRRLSELGLSYQGVVDDARRELSLSLLRDSDYPLVEVAYLVGFSEQSAFNRAFRRWAGETPRSYRLRAS